MITQPDPPKPNWPIRAYRAGDETALVALFARVFGRVIDEAHWRWKLNARPSSVPNVWLAVYEDAPIFQYAGIPVRLQLPTGEMNAMVSVDTMTSPDFRRRGLLSQVGEHTYACWRDAGVTCVLGLPNEQWGSRTQALGWQKLFPLQWLTLPLRPQIMLARRLRQPWLRRWHWVGAAWRVLDRLRHARPHALTLERISVADARLDALWERCRTSYPISVRRDSAWVQWRYLDCPSKTYEVTLAECAGEPAGYAALTIQRGETCVGTVAELFCARNDEAAFDALVESAIQASDAANAQSVNTLAVPGTWVYEAFRRRGFVASHAFSLEVVPLNMSVDALRDAAQWHVAGGDFDVV